MADQRQPVPAAKCFRLRRYYLVIGVLGTVFCAVMGITSTLVAYFNVDGSFPQPRVAALIFGVFWSGILLLGVWIIAAYFRERLFLTNDTIIQHGVFCSRTIHFWEMPLIKWRSWPVGGSMIVRTHSETINIYLDNFTRAERDEIVRFFRETFDKEIQENWPRFEESDRKVMSPQTTRRACGVFRIYGSLLLGFTGFFVYIWFSGRGVRWLVVGLVNAVAAVWCFWMLAVVKKRSLMEESNRQSEQNPG